MPNEIADIVLTDADLDATPPPLEEWEAPAWSVPAGLVVATFVCIVCLVMSYLTSK